MRLADEARRRFYFTCGWVWWRLVSLRLGRLGSVSTEDGGREEETREESGLATELVARIVGFDVGDRRIGVALSDELGFLAQPLFTLHRAGKRADMKAVARVLRKYHVKEAVVGNPLYMSGDQSPQAAKAQAFAAELKELVPEGGLTVHLWDERLTTTQAHRQLDEMGHGAKGREGRKGIIDQVAAVLILQSFLDARANKERFHYGG